TAQTNTQTNINSRRTLHNFVDPVTLKIQELKAQGLSNDQITAELEKLNMGWYPETGATWIGKPLTSEEITKMPASISTNTYSKGKAALQQNVALSSVTRTSSMRTTGSSWIGVGTEMVCGSMSVASGQTLRNYLCVQMGDLNGATNWAEVVVTHNYGETYKWLTFDPDDGAWINFGDKNTATTAADTYVMLMDGTSDGYGYHYDVYINNQWARHGHLANYYVQAGFQKEVSSDTGTFTNDGSNAVFYRNWLNGGSSWSYWTSNGQWSSSLPVRESHSSGALSYNWQTWVQN
ncbi:MAG TPA: hypothetical protein VLH35_02405, partial [Candidatus Acidoferrales bacterium]|nr:hypothetical protein [Candidatus Acidoferrales bacterium]